MKGEELIKLAIGKKLKSGRVQSFFLKGELVDRIIVTFLKFDDWIRIVSTDEMTNLSLEDEAIDEVGYYGGDEFKYPVEPIEIHFPEFKKYIGKKLLAYKELISKKDKGLSFGLNLYFENDLNFVIHNQDYPIDMNEYFFENYIPEDLIEK
jgi:hypothetical protein